MANHDISSRLRYLKNSAQLMSTGSPETSAYLMSQANQLLFDHEIEPPESHRRYACGACGSIMISGWTSSMEKEAIEAKSQRRNSESEAGFPKLHQSAEKNTGIMSLLYKCNLCGKHTRHRQPIQTIPAYRRGKRTTQSVRLASPATSTVVEKASTSTSSKKRARARKHGGLQALLAAKKESGGSSMGFGLDLMDLMKKA